MELTQVGKYKIVEKLGQGAMGEVFRAHDPVLGRDVAIKTVAGKLSNDEAARQRFQREARSAAQLNHPNIITVYDFGEEQGTAYMAMELLEGSDLKELIEKDTAGSLQDKLAIMEQLLDGLAFAHDKEVLHRDLKPGNVHILPNGQVKIMDFGLARRAADGAATDVIMGTPYYMSPEQAQGERATKRSDIFSLGAVFYELLTGRRPFTGATIPAVLFAVVHREPEPLGEIVPEASGALEALVARALEKNPDERFQDATEMLHALRVVWAGGELPEAVPRTGEDAAPAQALGPPLSASGETPAELREAVEEIEQYLADRVPPLMVASAVATFSEAPTDGAAAEIWGWSERQIAIQSDLPLVDLLFHALHKLSVIGEFHLVEEEKLLGFLREVGARLVDACAPADRGRLRRALSHLGEAEMVRSGSVAGLKKTPEQAPPEPMPTPSTPGLRRLSLLEQRLRREPLGQGPGAEVSRRRVASQAIAVAAVEAKSEKELEDHLRRLRRAGVASGADQVFRSLGQELADWAMPKEVVSDTKDLGPPNEVKAMKQIVSLPEDPIEVARRYRYLVDAATEQFNQGNLGRAVQMYDLAAKLATEKKVDSGFTAPVLKRGQEALDPARLREYMEKPDRHPQLLEVMGFFQGAFGPEPLLNQLEVEDRRDRRRLLLDLLVVHGEPARALARQRLEAPPEDATDFARRNWIHLLRVIPRPASEPADGEIDAVARVAGPTSQAFLVKEAFTHLGQTHHSRAAHALVTLLRSWETHLERRDLDPVAREDGLAVLDRLSGALARQRHPAAWRALLDHAVSGRPEIGATEARLAELGSQDLSSSPELVASLVAAIKESLPRGVLGRLVGRKGHDLPALVGALASTHSPEVRALLEEVAHRFPGQDAGEAARRAIDTVPPAPAPALAAPSGELETYGLPALLHRLAETRATGTLNVLPREGSGPPAALTFAEGQVRTARWAHRDGADAVYQLFERPVGGTYAFEAAASAEPAPASPLPEVAALIREGIRRARELQRTSAIVPDDTPLEATGTAPGTVEDESEYELIVTLWEKACAGMPAGRIEAELKADAFRILRALAQWLDEAALRVVEVPAAAAPRPSASSTS
jgi:tRNA A-37 threonylcarbamoyl transferase component Bud32